MALSHGPPSTTLAKHQTNIGSMSLVCRDAVYRAMRSPYRVLVLDLPGGGGEGE